MAKSIILTYILWLFGGGFGLHHFYLKRDIQGFLYLCFPGGYFGAGWIRDVWRIPAYVREANDDPFYLKDITEKMRTLKKPPFSFARLGGQLIVGNLFGMLMAMSVPDPKDIGVDLLLVADLLAPAATAFGIFLVGNIGKERGSIWWPLLGCYLTAPFHVLGYSSYIWTTLCGMIGWQLKSKQWKRFVRDPNPNWKRILIVLMAFGLYLGLWSSYVYFNLKIVTKDGDKIKFRDAAENFLKSPAVHQFKDNLGHLWKHMWEHGFWSTMSQLIESLDPLGEKHALRVLELKRGVSQEEIKARYRDLSKKWHPDKFPNEVEKEDAHAKFVEIQQAYEKLSQIKKKRKLRSTYGQNDDDERTEY